MSGQADGLYIGKIEHDVSGSKLSDKLGTKEPLGWHNVGITILEQFTMNQTGWVFCVVAGNTRENTVKLDCEAVGKGTISWTGTLEELFSEFERT